MEGNDRGPDSASRITVVELVSGFGRRSFGLGYAALNLAAAVHRAGAKVYLASLDEEKDAREACEAVGFPQQRVICGAPIGRGSFRVAPLLSHRLSKVGEHGNTVIHLHGLWTHASYIAGAQKKRRNCPLVLSPHGELEPYALGISKKFKAAASALYARRNVMEASCLWALSEQEKASARDFGYHGRVEVIPNGVNRGIECTAEEIAAFRSRHDVAEGSRVLLFLSRIARKKNLPLLLKTFAKNVRLHSDWTLIVAGADERGHLKEVQSLVGQLGIEKFVRLIGPVTGREKGCAFAASSLFVLPSHSEGLPIAVLEAMEYRTPVLITEGWTLPVKAAANFGWTAPVDEAAFEKVLLEALSTREQTLVDMGLSAQVAVRKHFNWESVGQRACQVYASLTV